MGALRNFAVQRQGVAFAILLLAFAVRLAIPDGFMPAQIGGHTVITLCSGHGPMPMPGHHHGRSDDGDKAAAPCGFGALSLTATGGADPIVLADAITPVFERATLDRSLAGLRLPGRLRPPLRAPPLQG